MTSEEQAVPLEKGVNYTTPFRGWYISDKTMQGLLANEYPGTVLVAPTTEVPKQDYK